MIVKSFLDNLDSYLKQKRLVQFVGPSGSYGELVSLGIYDWIKKNQKNLYSELGYNNLVIVTPSYKDFSSWSKVFLKEEKNFYPLSYWGVWGADRYSNNSYLKLQRLKLLSTLALEQKKITQSGNIIVTTYQGLAQKTLPQDDFSSQMIHIKKDQIIDIDSLVLSLEERGYRQDSSVQEEGFFALRGGILDIFSPTNKYPCRIEFWGDKVVSLRLFDPESQSSFDELDSFWISVFREVIFRYDKEIKRKDSQHLHEFLSEFKMSSSDREELMREFDLDHKGANIETLYPIFRTRESTVFSQLADDSIFLFPKTRAFCEEEYESFLDEVNFSYKKDIEEGKISIPPSSMFCSVEELNFKDSFCIEFSNPSIDPEAQVINYTSQSLSVQSGQKDFVFDNWMKVIEDNLTSKAVVILASMDETYTRLVNILEYKGIHFKLIKDGIERLIIDSKLDEGVLYVSTGYLSSYLVDDSVLIISDHVLFGKSKPRKQASKKLQNYLSSFKELTPGKLIVHVEHGIGKYLGIVSLTIGGTQNDFLQIEYADKDKILVPVYRLDFLQKYNGGTDEVSLDKLKSKGWVLRKSKVKKQVKDIAEELLKLQAERKVSKGVSLSPISEDYYKFEQSFMYEETTDQLRAIEEVNQDLSETKPMDRLICGDVGFGKTEVALRAVYRTCMDGYQALVLVPTTVLCYQHYKTFLDRLSSYGIKVAQANRFVSSSQIKANIEGVQNGTIDVLIGTHRLLSKDIKIKKLGLLVIDEEQKFGVMHKEKIKKFQYGCNVLTLSATPIPRTLHMALLGLKDISLISTPPINRLGIKTYVANLDPLLIKEAIRREVLRGGQVFFVHNRVENIASIYAYLKELLPEISMKVAHGQMRESDLEQVIVDFLDNKFSVLICTTIIESGIDMPNVNTMIVNNADKFGLAELYQLRGRVGRSSRQAYAYFLAKDLKAVSEEAMQRLNILSSYQDLGAGFEIASHDLELRGAGDLIGARQSGNVNSVGFEMYTQMLEEAVKELQGEKVEEKVDVEIKIPVGVSIPKNYIKEENLRLNLYKQIFSVSTLDEIDSILKDTLDRYGMFPVEVFLLFKVAYLKRAMIQCGGRSIAKISEDKYEIKFGSLTEKQIDAILKLVSVNLGMCSITPDYKLIINLIGGKKSTVVSSSKGIKDHSGELSGDSISTKVDRLIELEQKFSTNKDVVNLNKILGVVETLAYSLQ